MAALAKGLPVAFIPEQFLIAPVRDDVIDHRRRGEPILFHTFNAQGMPSEVSLSRCPPTGVVPACVRAATQPITAPRHMIFAEYLTRLAEARTAGIAAGSIWFLGHILLLSKQQKSSVVIHRFAALILHGPVQRHN